MTDDLFSVAGVPLDPVPLVVGPISKHPLYGVLMGMRTRCHNPKYRDFKHYGGRGIVVCDEWRKSSRAFMSWALANGWKPGLEIDRIDNDGGYSPGNCRFVTSKLNQRNRRDTVRMSDGEALIDVCERSGIPYDVARRRYGFGWSVEDCAFAPSWVATAPLAGLQYQLRCFRHLHDWERCETIQAIIGRLDLQRAGPELG